MEVVYADNLEVIWLTDLEKNYERYCLLVLKFNRSLIKPKLHYIYHIIENIRRNGPVVRFDTMDMERRHKTSINFMNSTKNFEATTQSVSEYNQFLQ